MTEKAKVVYEGYRHQMTILHRKELRLNRESARALYDARMLGKACNIIWQKNFEAAATRPNRTQKEINDLTNIYCTLREKIQELKFKAEALDHDCRMLRREVKHMAFDAITRGLDTRVVEG